MGEEGSTAMRSHGLPAVRTAILCIGCLFPLLCRTYALEGHALVRDSSRVMLVDCATGVRELVAEGNVAGACFSPEGDRIAYVKDDAIHVTGGPGETARRLGSGGVHVNLSWAIDDALYWVDGRNIYRFPAAGGARTLVHRIVSGIAVFHWGGASVCGTRAGAQTSGLTGVDLLEHTETVIGGGCNASISSDGMRGGNFHPSHGAVQFMPFDTSEIDGYKLIPFRGMGGFTAFSRSSPDHILVQISPSSIDTGAVFGAYIIDIHSEVISYIGSGTPLDYHPSPGRILLPSVRIQTDTVRFFAERGEEAALAKRLTVVNSGAGAMRLVETRSSATWLEVTRLGKANAQSLTLTVDTTGVADGVYSTRVAVHAANALTQDTVVVILSLGVSSGPVLALSSEEIAARAREGDSNPQVACIDVTNAGSGRLGGLDTEETAPWLSTQVQGSGNSFRVCNTIDVADLEAGTYSARVVLRATGAVASTAYTVNLTVTSAGEPATLVVMPDSAVIGPGQSVTFAAEARDSDGVSIDAPISWFRSGALGTISDLEGPTTVFTAPETAPHTVTLEARCGYITRYIRVHIDADAKPFITVIAPRQGIRVPPDTTLHIEWTTNLVDRVNLSYCINGDDWIMFENYGVTKGVDSTWGRYPWRVPNRPGDTCIIRVMEYNSHYPACSGWFVIRDDSPVLPPDGALAARETMNPSDRTVVLYDIMGRVTASSSAARVRAQGHGFAPGYYIVHEPADTKRISRYGTVLLNATGYAPALP